MELDIHITLIESEKHRNGIYHHMYLTCGSHSFNCMAWEGINSFIIETEPDFLKLFGCSKIEDLTFYEQFKENMKEAIKI